MLRFGAMATTQHLEPPAVKLLDQWLEKQHMSVPKFAALIKREGQMVHAWRYNRARPDLVDMLAMERLTGISLSKWMDKKQKKRLLVLYESGTLFRNARGLDD